VDTGSVDHDGAPEQVLSGFKVISPPGRRFHDTMDRTGQVELHAICGCLLTQVDRQLIRAADAAGFRQQGADRIRIDQRFPFAQFRTADQPQARDAIYPSSGQQCLKPRLLIR